MSAPLAIYALGDSQTMGFDPVLGITPMSGYRRHLLDALTLSGVEAALVGPLTDPYGLRYANYPGMTIADYVTLATPDLASHDPDVVLLMLGTRDAGGGSSTMTASMAALVDAIRATKPCARLVVSTIPPIAWVPSIVTQYNADLAGICAAKGATLVSPWFTPDDIIGDGLHLDDSGYQKLAGAFFRAIQAIRPIVGRVKLFDAEVGAYGAPSIELPAIPGTFRALEIVYDVRGDAQAPYVTLHLRLASGTSPFDSSASYDAQGLGGSGSSVMASEAFEGTSLGLGVVPAAAADPTLSASGVLDCPNYAGPFQKHIAGRLSRKLGTTSGDLRAITISGFWRSTAPISGVQIFPASGGFVSGSMAAVYGLP